MMSYNSNTSNTDLRLAVLRFWAEGAEIAQRFDQAEIMSVPELAAAIEAVKLLPAAIGWEDEQPGKFEGVRPIRRAPERKS
jgi:hypothetical protein